MFVKHLSCLVALLTFTIASVANAGVVIDDFTQTVEHSASVSGGIGPDTDTQVGIPVANTVGGQRQLDINVTNAGAGGTSEIVVRPPTLGGILSVDNGSGRASVASVTWGAGGVLGDLTDGGSATHLYVNVLFADLSDSISLSFEITDTNAVVDTQTMTPLGPGGHLIPLDDFVGVDFTTIDRIVMTASGDPAFDLTIQLVDTRAVPEPVGLAVWSVALTAGYFGVRRRRRAA